MTRGTPVQDRGHVANNPAHVDVSASGRRREMGVQPGVGEPQQRVRPIERLRIVDVQQGQGSRVVPQKPRQSPVFHNESTAGVDQDNSGLHAPDQIPTDELPVARPAVDVEAHDVGL